jgi:hypothetical protein
MNSRTVPRQTPAGPPKTPAPVSADDAAKARKSIAKLDEVLAMVTKALLTIGGGALIFTCVNVTLFGISHQIPWYIAWMLDPLASLALITVLYVDGVLAEHGGDYKPGGWPFLLRWTAGLSTWVMNCWTSLYPDGRFHFIPQTPDAGGILLHSVAPALLILLAEAATGYRKYATRRRGELAATIAQFETAKATEREAAAKREQTQREAARREREELARLENERRTAEIEAADRKHRAEIEAERERLALTERTAEIETSRRKTEAEIEDRRRREQWEREQAERDREAARQAEIVKAEAQAEALRKEAEAKAEALHREAEAAAEAERIKAEAEARALEEAEKLKRQRALERAAAKARGTSESGGARTSISTGRTSENGAALSAVPALAASEIGGRIPRDVREKQRDEAERYIAKCSLSGIAPDLERLGNQYGKGETWVGDRVRAAKKRLAEEDGFEDSVIADALDVFEDETADAGSAGAA